MFLTYLTFQATVRQLSRSPWTWCLFLPLFLLAQDFHLLLDSVQFAHLVVLVDLPSIVASSDDSLGLPLANVVEFAVAESVLGALGLGCWRGGTVVG